MTTEEHKLNVAEPLPESAGVAPTVKEEIKKETDNESDFKDSDDEFDEHAKKFYREIKAVREQDTAYFDGMVKPQLKRAKIENIAYLIAQDYFYHSMKSVIQEIGAKRTEKLISKVSEKILGQKPEEKEQGRDSTQLDPEVEKQFKDIKNSFENLEAKLFKKAYVQTQLVFSDQPKRKPGRPPKNSQTQSTDDTHIKSEGDQENGEESKLGYKMPDRRRDRKAREKDEEGSVKSSGKVSPKSGPWTDEEQDRFKQAVRLFGKDWKKIGDFVATRSRAQIGSYSQNLRKVIERKNDKNHPEYDILQILSVEK